MLNFSQRLLARIQIWTDKTVQRVLDISRGTWKRRSPLWASARREFLKTYPHCVACGTDLKVEAHHVRSFATHPSLELSWMNLRALCDGPNKCHFRLGHQGPSGKPNWKTTNPDVDRSIFEYRKSLAVPPGV